MEHQLPPGSDVWLRVSPITTAWAHADSFFSRLSQGGLPEHLAHLGIQGIFFSGAADTGDEWKGRSPAVWLGQDAVSLEFGRISGTKQEYKTLLEQLGRAGLLTGGRLLPAAPGMGPDFALAVRSVRNYPGMFTLMEIPPLVWTSLPQCKEGEWIPLDNGQLFILRQQGVIPSSLSQDLSSGQACGWMVSGPVVGVDGVTRRWACRWYGSPDRPVLHWDDPSGTARRLMESSAILEAGLRHSFLLSLSLEAWSGLEVAPSCPSSVSVETFLEPAVSALRDMTRHIHHYGAAVLLEDTFPPSAIPVLQACGTDAVRDTFMEPSLSLSLLQSDAAPLRNALRHSLELGVDHTRLWHGPRDGMPTNSSLPLPPAWSSMLTHDGELRLNAPTLAAVICGLKPGDVHPAPEHLSALLDIHELQIAMNALIPGLLVLSGSDLSVSIPDDLAETAVPPAWILDAVPSTRQGLPAGRSLAGDTSLLPGVLSAENRLKKILNLRSISEISRGTLVDVPDSGNQAVIALLSRLPSGKILAVFGNFSAHPVHIRPTFPAWQENSRNDALSGQNVGTSIKLSAWGWRSFYLSTP